MARKTKIVLYPPDYNLMPPEVMPNLPITVLRDAQVVPPPSQIPGAPPMPPMPQMIQAPRPHQLGR